jgi:predicted O-methyltransferase YrrM
VNDREIARPPAALDAILRDTEASGFTMASEPQTGSFLRTLATTKPGGRFLELGTGTGVATAWLLSGMDDRATLVSVEQDERVLAIATRHLGHDPRVSFHLGDGAAFLETCAPRSFDLIFADTWPGKFTHLESALSLVRRGGIYLVDDLLPQPNWPPDHAPKVPRLIAELERQPDFTATRLTWASGLLMLVRSRN